MRYGRQRWKLKGKIEVNGKQSWDGEEMVFLPLIVGLISIKVCMLTPLPASKAGVKNLPSHAPSAKTQKQIIKLFKNEPQLVFLTHLLKCCSVVQFRYYKTNQFVRAVGEIFFPNRSLSITVPPLHCSWPPNTIISWLKVHMLAFQQTSNLEIPIL